MPKYNVFWDSRKVGVVSISPMMSGTRKHIRITRDIGVWSVKDAETPVDVTTAIEERTFLLNQMNLSVDRCKLEDIEDEEYRRRYIANIIGENYVFKGSDPSTDALIFSSAPSIILDDYEDYEWLFDNDCFEPVDTPPDYETISAPDHRKEYEAKIGEAIAEREMLAKVEAYRKELALLSGTFSSSSASFSGLASLATKILSETER